jgi:predicted unusual protein kinase regulating ubiquinone biosynthesis (AarF/ABC1/UbiB family)
MLFATFYNFSSLSYVHSDPHPGNILVNKNKNGGTDIILLDHGLYAVILSGVVHKGRLSRGGGGARRPL